MFLHGFQKAIQDHWGCALENPMHIYIYIYIWTNCWHGSHTFFERSCWSSIMALALHVQPVACSHSWNSFLVEVNFLEFKLW